MTSGLYHCTSIENIVSILSSKAFFPSFCLEKAEYLKHEDEFAFAMVCFADLQQWEIQTHMNKFKGQAYLKMKKEWAIRKGVNPISYYNRHSRMCTNIRTIIDRVIKDTKDGENSTAFGTGVNMIMAHLKSYDGQYWMLNENKWSDKTVFYTEREWRYIPFVINGEAFYLDTEEYKDDAIRNEKRQELINNGYILDFCLNDVLEIGVEGKNLFDDLTNRLKDKNLSLWIKKLKCI